MSYTRQSQQFILNVMKLLLICINTAVFAVFWYLYYSRVLYIPFYRRGDYVVIGLFFLLYACCSKLYGGMELTVSRISEIAYSQCIAVVMTHFFIYIITWLLVRHLPNVIPIIGSALLCMVAGIIWAKIANMLTNKVVPPKQTVLIYDNEEAHKNGEYIIHKISWRFNLVGQINVQKGISYAIHYIHEHMPEAVMLCGLHSSQRNTILKFCIEHDIVVYLRPNIGDYIVNSASNVQLANLPVMLCQRSSPSLFYTCIKRTGDIVLSIIGLIVLSPVMLMTALAIKFYDNGPILYKQRRITKDRKIFNIYKFRSMKTDAEKDGIARLAGKKDDRITPVGKIIRACRIDEIPQLVCILKGDMSIVGPRPERPEIAEKYEAEMPEFALRLQVKAGLTGYAQVFGKYNTAPYDKLQMDLMYISQLSLVNDLKIILATIKILFMPESTEGVSDSPMTADEDFSEDSQVYKYRNR